MDAVALQALRTTSPRACKHKQAMYAKNGEWYSGSSGGEEWRPQGQPEEIMKLRAQVELLGEQQGAGKSQRTGEERE